MITDLYFNWLTTLNETGKLPTAKEVLDTVSMSAAYREFDAKVPDYISNASRRYKTRQIYIHKYGFPLITKDVLEEMVKFLEGKKVLEVCSGTGYIASWLKAKGIDVIATDNMSWHQRSDFQDWIQYTSIENIDAAEAVKKYGDGVDYVMVSWPNYESDIGAQILELCVEKNIPLIYIGEDMGGCTANDRFFTIIEDHCGGSMERIVDSYVPFEGIHDQIFLITPNN